MKKILVPEYIKGLIFDCDGTLVDSMPFHMKAWEHAIKHFGAPWDYDLIFSRKGISSTDVVELYNREHGTNLDVQDVSKIKQGFFRRYYSEIQPIKPVVDIVQRFKNVLPMAVASGGSRENVHSQLNVIGIKEHFQVILTSDDKVKTKPAPDIFLKAAEVIGIPPHQCQVFEDGDVGLEGAQKAGMFTTDVRDYLEN